MLQFDQKKGIWVNGAVLTFDFAIEDLKQYYSATAPQRAYEIVKKYLVKHGFSHLKDTDYKNQFITKYDTVDILYQFSLKNKWFPYCIKKLIISPNIITLDISKDIQALQDEKWAKKHLDRQNNSAKQI